MPLLKTLAPKAVAQIAQTAAAVAAAIVLPGSTAISALAGGLSKELVEALLASTTQVERQLDKLLRAPLKSALQLLNDAALNTGEGAQETASRDALLDQAHTKFVTASALVGDSREDSLFIAALDCIALAERTGRSAVAAEHLRQATLELDDVHRRLTDLEKEAAEWTEHVDALNRFLGRGKYHEWGEKPLGYADQVALAKRQEKQALKVAAEAHAAGLRFTVLKSLVALATASLQRASASGNAASRTAPHP